jgi:hypothetical protein
MNNSELEALPLNSQTFMGMVRDWNPNNGDIIMTPEEELPGFWVGCAGIFQDSGRTYITFRKRRPRGLGAERGWYCGIAELEETGDGYNHKEIWSVHKDELNTASMERFALRHSAVGGYDLYLSFVDPVDSRWRVDVLHSKSLSDFDVSKRSPVLSSQSTDTEGIKDPFILEFDGEEWMFLSVAKAAEIADADSAHGTQDIFNTKFAKSATGLATRRIGDSAWNWKGYVLEPEEGTSWDSNTRRINSVVKLSDCFLAFYDGKASHEDNYEEKTGLATSQDLVNWTVLTPNEPIVLSDSISGSVRYVDIRVVNGGAELIYELTRPDGSHDLRTHKLRN